MNQNSLVLYKNRPARLLQLGDRLEIELQDGETVRVRVKDVTLLHPGPMKSLGELKPQSGDLDMAWQILAGEQTNLPELAELIYGAFTPATAWAAFQQLLEGIYFEGTPESIRARTEEEVARKKSERDQAEANQRARQAFYERVRKGALIPEDRERMRDVENLALGRGQHSNVLRELGRAETIENAHALLLALHVWGPEVNPYPSRSGLTQKQPEMELPALPEEDRCDLTGLQSFAIDDESTDTPDDAIALEELADGFRLWVHVADAAALVAPGSALDLEARARGESLHLPEGTIHMLPREMTERLGLGMNETSPALSFGIRMNADGEVLGLEIERSRVRVARFTYDRVDELLDQQPFDKLAYLTGAVRARRQAAGAVMIDFPEVHIEITQGEVSIRPLPRLRSRMLVEEAMILAGTETARYASAHGLLLPYSQQDPVETSSRPETLSGMFALRRLMKRARHTLTAGPHNGLGVPAYVQVTSPLRRYLDLVSHQQIRALLRGDALIDETGLLERVGAAESVAGVIRQAEFSSEKHWTLVYLSQHPDWRGGAILVEKRGSTGIFLIPSLALEARATLKNDLPLDAPVTLQVSGVDLPQRDARFRLVD